MFYDINVIIHKLVKIMYPWMQNIPLAWTLMVHYFEKYKLLIGYKIFRWIPAT